MVTFAPSYIPPAGMWLSKRSYHKLEGKTISLMVPNKTLPNRINILKPPQAGPLSPKPIKRMISKGKYFVEDADCPGSFRVLSYYKILRYYYGIKPRKKLKARSWTTGPATFIGKMPMRQDLEVLPDDGTYKPSPQPILVKPQPGPRPDGKYYLISDGNE